MGFKCGNNKIIDGRPGYHPKDRLRLYLYGYLNRIRTSRLLERECKRNIELIWLMKGLSPCFRTIAGFRSENPLGLKNLFRHFVKMMQGWGLLEGENKAIDGSKFRAVNSKKYNFNEAKIMRQEKYIDEKINEYLQALEQADASDDKLNSILTEKLTKQLLRKDKYAQIKQKLVESGVDQISTTDPDARSMILHGSVIEVAYNVQTVVDSAHKLIVHYEPTNTNDRKALFAAALTTKEILNKDSIIVLADKGYHNAEQLNHCKQENIITYVSAQEIPRNNPVSTELYYGEKFVYHANEDVYVCPKGEQLKTNGREYAKKYKNNITKVKHYKTKACRACLVKSLCTNIPLGRLIERSEYAPAVEENNKRIINEKERYLQRQCIIEHVFDTIKRQWGFEHILLKGLKKNSGEFGLIYFTYNFRRVMNIFGFQELKKRLERLISTILRLLSTMNHDRNLKIFIPVMNHSTFNAFNYCII